MKGDRYEYRHIAFMELKQGQSQQRGKNQVGGMRGRSLNDDLRVTHFASVFEL
jgi:hypothetical protein